MMMVDFFLCYKSFPNDLWKINWVLREENLSVEDQESFREHCHLYDLGEWENEKSSFSAIKKKKLFQEETNIKEKKTKTRVIIIKKFIQDLDFECEDA